MTTEAVVLAEDLGWARLPEEDRCGGAAYKTTGGDLYMFAPGSPHAVTQDVAAQFAEPKPNGWRNKSPHRAALKNTSGIHPVDMRVLVKPDPVEEKTKGGIIITDAAKDREKYAGTRATLIAAGPNAFKEWGGDNGISPGSRVHFAQYSGARIKGEDGEDYVIMNDADLTCMIEGSQ